MKKLKLLVLAVLPIPAFFFSLVIGQFDIPPLTVYEIFFTKLFNPLISSPWPPAYEVVVWNIRLPRVLLALLVGASLSVSGTALQGLFRNPLVSPYILGLSWGANFGVALSLLIPLPFSPQFMAFSFGLLAVFLAYSIAKVRGETPVISLVLAGVIVSAFFTALQYIAKFFLDPQALQGLVYWMMGGFYLAHWDDVMVTCIPIIFSVVMLSLMSWRINVLSMGDAEAKMMGLNTELNKVVIIVLATVMAAVAVSVVGTIGWVGLIIPHLVRMAVGPDHRKLIPLSATVGAAFLLVADDLARSITTYELPVGILTTLSGVPFFVYLLKKTKGRSWS
ncbi:MAG: iron ABC transporter permease [Thermoprotei archaeon]|nr:MAG: iron ABC transporter permease [Thermoprotei archaeon]RLF22886.1 MAG: iron ABC transporter permease [Thermoprotei archaeon]